MAQTLRKPDILDIARREGKVTVDRLVAVFDVTPQTIRRDLSELADAGLLERVHGGAVLPSSTANIGYAERRQLNQAAKVDIARACARHIPNDTSVFLNIGTTTEAVAAELRHHQGLLVVTNNINIPAILSDSEAVEVVVTGGNLRRSDGGLVGYLASQTIRQFCFDHAVIGCSALGPAGEILDFDIEEVGVSRAIIEQSAETFLVADASKHGRKAPALIATLDQMHTVFSDQPLPPDCMVLCAAQDTQVVIAGAEN